MKKSVLIIGSGGREHALGWKFAQSPHVGKIYFAPGNGGTDEVGENIDIDVLDIKKLVAFAKDKKIDLTFVGPEAPLCAGIVDEFEKQGLPIFGPDKNGAQLEGDKSFACDFMKRYAIPHPQSEMFTIAEDAKHYIEKIGAENCVIKASGLAAGKGVILPNAREEAFKTIDDIMNKKIFGKAGSTVVIQERLSGPEISIIAFTDGSAVVPLVPSQDHKRVNDHDEGPNTGGMGAYAPAPFVNEKEMQLIQTEILEKTITGLKKEKIVYKGILYAGLMMTQDGPKVLEYNVRFGDPETQPLMMLLDSDLYEIAMACIEGNLSPNMIKVKQGASVCVVITAKGYPDTYEKDKEIMGLDTVKDQNSHVFHAGTQKKDNRIVSSGGRVLGVTAYESTVKNAYKRAYSTIGEKGVYFENMHYRKDIAYQALNSRNI